MTRTTVAITESASGRTSASVVIGIQDGAVNATDWERGKMPHQTRKQSLTPAIAKAAVSTGLRFKNLDYGPNKT